RKELKREYKILLTFLVVLVVVVANVAMPSTPTNEPNHQASSSEKTSMTPVVEEPSNVVIDPEQRKKDYLEFYNEILRLDNEGKAIYQNAVSGVEDVASGKRSGADLYVEF